MKISKSYIEVYHFDSPNFGEVHISITIEGDSRIIIIDGDFITEYKTYKTGFGSFKQFIVNCEMEYIAELFKQNTSFDVEKTMSTWHGEAMSRATQKSLPADDLNTLQEHISELYKYKSTDTFYQAAWNDPIIYQFFNGIFPNREYMPNPRFKQFWDEVFVPFKNKLSFEIQEEITNKKTSHV